MEFPRWIRRVDRYFGQDGWSLVAFQPILYFFLWGAAIRLWIDADPPPNFDDIITQGFYPVWLSLGIIGPPLALLSWFLIQKCYGKWTFIGMWVRWAADVTMFIAVLTYHLTNVAKAATESRIYSRYIVGATLVFILCLIVRDAWVIFITERLAMRIHRGEQWPS
jgi:hypothetical protein